MSFQGTGRGKVLLLGEHAVVNGQPALALALDRGALATLSEGPPGVELPALGLAFAPEEEVPGARGLDRALRAISALAGPISQKLSLSLLIPPSRGLGSSAALCVAAARALLAASGREGSLGEVLRAAGAGEAVFHGQPSGVDAAASALGGGLLFVRGDPPALTALRAGARFELILADTGERAPTSSLVARVQRAREERPARLSALFSEIGELARAGAQALSEGDLAALGRAMNRNQALLSELGLSTPLLDAGIEAARAAGALGAKLTGAGGGGCLVALAEEAHAAPIRDALRAAGCQPLALGVDPALFRGSVEG